MISLVTRNERRENFLLVTRHSSLVTMITILQKIPFFSALPEADLKAIVEKIQMEYYPANYTLFNQGDAGEVMYVIKRGKVSVERNGAAIARLQDNDFFGEMALVSNEVRNATIKTVTEVELLTLHKKDFTDLMSTNPTIASTVSYEVVRRANQND
ncbi:cyclic nucleotide-binding domain-containing protein [Candidatus Peregrinibacteria bacterium]|nr:cyclic nucleotide-binding domain-containing protein [Candidatus Peregrinibacteria bacterium]